MILLCWVHLKLMAASDSSLTAHYWRNWRCPSCYAHPGRRSHGFRFQHNKMSQKSAVAHWTLSIPTLFQHYFQQLFSSSFSSGCAQICRREDTDTILHANLGAVWSGCDTSLWRSLSCQLVSVRVEKKFSSVLQRFNWSQSECGTLSQYVGHETRDGDAVQSYKKSWTSVFWIFSRKNEFIILPIVAITEQKNILWFTNRGELLLFCQWR